MAIKILTNDQNRNMQIMSEYLSMSLDKYSNYLGNKVPLYVTYYARNSIMSADGSTLGNVTDFFSNESAQRYEKINNVPLYSVQDISWGQEETEFGLETNVDNQGIIIPNTVVPNTADYMEIRETSTSKPIFFQITDVTVSNITDKKFFQISFSLANNLPEDIQVCANKEMVISNTGDFYAVELELIDYLGELNSRTMEFISDYDCFFRNRNQLRFIKYVCPEIVTFLNNEKVNILKNTKYFFGWTPRDTKSVAYYRNSVYYEILEKFYRRDRTVKVKLEKTLFYTDTLVDNYSLDWIKQERCVFTDGTIATHNKSFLSSKIEQIINDLLNDEINTYEKAKETVESLRDIKVNVCIEDFLSVPIILFIFKVLEDKLLTNQTSN